MQDLQRRLATIDPAVTKDPPGCFAAGTETAVRRFQEERGLRIDGVCGRQTWDALVESGYRLGDRLLYRRTPMLRGDDVADLQVRLAALGFDTGRVDGIFGDDTARALSEFQRNVGLKVDGIVGRATVAELMRLRPRSGPQLVTTVRERERLRRAPHTLSGWLIAIGDHGGMGATSGAVARVLSAAGAEVVSLLHPDGSKLAEEANAAAALVFVGIGLEPEQARCTTAYYSGYRSESAGGRRLAEQIQLHLPGLLGIDDGGIRGMSLPVLRETRMPAVLCEIGPAQLVVEHAPTLASGLRSALERWVGETWD